MTHSRMTSVELNLSPKISGPISSCKMETILPPEANAVKVLSISFYHMFWNSPWLAAHLLPKDQRISCS